MRVHPETMPTTARHVRRWFALRTMLAHQVPDVDALVLAKRSTRLRISVGIPARDEAPTIGPICRTIRSSLVDGNGLVDELVVLDGSSSDGTRGIARAAGARVVDVRELLPSVPYEGGKGESLWRSLTALDGDIVVWIDADIKNFEAHFVARLVAPLLLDPTVDFVKGFYGRPIQLANELLPTGGGRVTELMARPLLASLFPELGGFLQPLSGEYAGRADLLRRVPFFTGYSVEVGLLIDLLDLVGLDRMAQVDLGIRIHRNRPLDQLSPVAYAIAQTILRRAEEQGRIRSIIDFPANPLLLPRDETTLEVRARRDTERPPLSVASAYLEALKVASAR